MLKLKKISGAMVGLGLLGSQACAVDGMEEVDKVDGVSQELACYTNNGVNPMLDPGGRHGQEHR